MHSWSEHFFFFFSTKQSSSTTTHDKRSEFGSNSFLRVQKNEKCTVSVQNVTLRLPLKHRSELCFLRLGFICIFTVKFNV